MEELLRIAFFWSCLSDRPSYIKFSAEEILSWLLIYHASKTAITESAKLFLHIPMSLQALQTQVRQLSVGDRLTLMNFILQSVTQDLNVQTEPNKQPFNNLYPLRGLPIQIADDFDAPLPELWEALGE